MTNLGLNLKLGRVALNRPPRHCEERSDEAIQGGTLYASIG
jgi:hypothetical protein